MSKAIQWLDDNRIQVEPPKRPKKITATRLATILGLNPWSSPFAAWCEITKTYQEPFEDTIYTLAGKAIEPLQIAYMRKTYLLDIVTPADVYGEDYFKKTWGDFYPDQPVLGGMWDALVVDEGGAYAGVLEFKTTKRVEDWADGIPEYYGLQAALYAHLYGIEDVYMVASFLEDKDYQVPEAFVPSASNTIIRPFKMGEQYPGFGQVVDQAHRWWNDHVETGISPRYDEKRDKAILAELRKNVVAPTDDKGLAELLARAEEVQRQVDGIRAGGLDALEAELKKLQEGIKAAAMERFREGDKQVVLEGAAFQWQLARSERRSVDTAALKKAGLYDQYSSVSPVYKMTVLPK